MSSDDNNAWSHLDGFNREDPLGDKAWHSYYLALVSNAAMMNVQTVQKAMATNDGKLVPRNWQLASEANLGVIDHNATTGLYAMAFESTIEGKKEIIIAFRGADAVGRLYDPDAKAGALLGVETGPGLIATGLIGGTIGAISGEKLNTYLNDRKIYNQTDSQGQPWTYDPAKPD